MPHVHTEPGQHDHTASAYVFRTDFSEPKIMLHLHKKIGKYMQFGGHIELNETPWQAISHELEEESGYLLEDLAILQPTHRVPQLPDATVHPVPLAHSTHPFGNGIDHFHTDIAYAFTASKAPTQKPVEGESTTIKLLTKKELLVFDESLIPENVRQIALFGFNHVLAEWEAVPAKTYK
ncbi:MAG TPA: NUDIX domain-containing protein [Candidatus Chromulinivoraceae bacterium]|nr:NUDIX domain-containing protein [Candidatus Chromulinivoraceae bacterium]